MPGTTSTSVVARPRLDYLDGIRALAALYVVAHHTWITTWPQYPANTGPWAVGWLVYGHIAVSVFIVVSGFSLSIAPARRGWHLTGGTQTFLRRRAWRILPTYWAALALSCVVYGLVTRDVTAEYVDLRAIVVHGLLLQDVVDSAKPNGAFWSIAVEWQIYFVFPLLLLIRRQYGARAVVAAAGMTVVGAYLAASTWTPLAPLLHLTPQFLLLFAFGLAAATVVQADDEWPADRALGWLTVVGAILFVGLCIVEGPAWVDREYFWVDLLVGATAASLIGWLATDRPRRLAAVLGGWPLRNLGLFSYTIYCIHLPVLWLVWHFGVSRIEADATTKFVLLTAVGMPTVVAASWMFSRVFEKPFLTHRSFASVRDLLLQLVRLRGQPARRL